jgi:hypothetical protein
MPHVDIPESLFREIEKVLPGRTSAKEFVAQAIREKLSFEEGRREFYRLSDQTRSALQEKGLTETEILTDCDAFRRTLNG